MQRSLAIATVLSLLALACGGRDDGSPGGQGGGGGAGGTTTSCAIKIGYGQESYQPLTEGQEVAITHGPQGGYHIWGAFLARGFAPDQLLLLSYDLLHEDGTVYQANVPVAVPPLKYDRLVAGWREHTGLYGYLPQDHDPHPDLEGGKRLRLRMRLRDGVIKDPDTGFPKPGGDPTCQAEDSVLVTPVFPAE